MALSSGNDTYSVKRYGEIASLDGLGGTDTVYFERLKRAAFTITNNADGTVSVDSVSGASATYHLKLKNFEKLSFNKGQDVVTIESLINHAPTVAEPIADQNATAATPFSFVVPATTFVDSDTGDSLTYSASLSSGAALPSWLSFDAATLAFSGTPPSSDVGTIDVSVTATDTGSATVSDTFVITISGDQTLTGGNSDDVLTGGTGNDTLTGNAGNDTLTGGVGNDTIYGNTGNDTLYGNTGADTLYGGQGVDSLYGGQDADTLFGNYGNDTIYANLGDDYAHGGGDDDYMHGGAGNDTLLGGLGNDTLVGGAGNDTLTGGDGADIYQFTNSSGADVIADFNAASDTIRLQSNINDTGVTDAASMLSRVSTVAGNAVIDLGNGNTITLTGVSASALTADDFTFG